MFVIVTQSYEAMLCAKTPMLVIGGYAHKERRRKREEHIRRPNQEAAHIVWKGCGTMAIYFRWH